MSSDPSVPPDDSLGFGDSPAAGRADGGKASASDEPRLFVPGELIDGRYRVTRTIAHGGMGVVFEVRDEELGLRLALKAVKPHVARQAQTLDRFRREIRLARRVTHPNVCRLYGAGLHFISGLEVHYLTMELLEGETLGARLRRDGPISPGEAEPIVRQMTAGLAAAHGQGIVHRDLKPSNILLVPGEDGDRAVITDFGLARCLIPEEETSRLTATGQLMGTPAYFAPELLEGKTLTPASDIYALGVVVFEMLSGELPFAGRSPFVMALRRLSEPPRSIRELVPTLDRRWVNWLSHCLQRQSEHRPADGSVALHLFDQGELPTPRAPAFERSPSNAAVTTEPAVEARGPAERPGRRIFLAVTVIFLALLALLATFFVRRSGSLREEEPFRLAVARPEVTVAPKDAGSMAGEELAFELELAIRRSIGGLEGIHLVERRHSAPFGDAVEALGRATAADAIVTSRLEAATGQWRVSLERLETPSSRISWRHELAVPEAAPRLLVHAVDEALERGFAEFRRRHDQGALALDGEQYRELVRLSRELVSATRTSRSGLGPSAAEAATILAELDALRRAAPSDLEILLLEARWALVVGRQEADFLEHGEAAIERVKNLAPDDPRPIDLEIELAIARNRLDQGWRALDERRLLVPGDCDNELWAARLSEVNDQLELAIGTLERASEPCPSWDLLVELARIQKAAGKAAAARRTLERAQELAPEIDFLRQYLESFESFESFESTSGDARRTEAVAR